MRGSVRLFGQCVMAAFWVIPAGCAMVPQHQLVRCQEANRALTQRYKAALAEKGNAERHAREMEDRNYQAEQELAHLRQLNSTLETQLGNLRAGQQEMEQQYAAMMQQWRPNNPLPAQTTNRLNALAQRYPGSFEFDPATGISKFNTDILFETGKDDLRPEAQRLLSEFANIFNSAEAHRLNILIVGHTDDQRIARPETRAKHPTNWHLSAHRAIAVQQHLARAGIDQPRMGIAGYGEYQPLAANRSADSRQRNRRVEIYVLSPENAVAGRADWRQSLRPANSSTAYSEPY